MTGRADIPLVEELSPVPDVERALRSVGHLPGVALFESCLRRNELGRYSFLTADPIDVVRLPQVSFGDDPFRRLREITTRYQTETIDDLPPFQGGVAGVMSYELGHAFEDWPLSPHDEFQLPALAAGVYDWVIAWDHQENRAWILSHGFPETEPARRIDRAAERIRHVQQLLRRGGVAGVDHREPPASASAGGSAALRPQPPDRKKAGPEKKSGADIPVCRAQTGMSVPLGVKEILSPQCLAPQFPVFDGSDLTSDFSRDAYLRAVERTIEYIHAGDIFQANLSQRLLAPQRQSPLDLYSVLRERNRATFAGYFALDDWAIVSASPERFIRVVGDEVETRPIKGTRRRQPAPEADLFTRDELRESDKDQAENVMIVDLLRNDLSRVCLPGSIRVPQLCGVETYETVQHLVSEVRGRLEPPRDVWDLFRAVFPGGSITGAPKVRAMEIISELEPTARGPYCGSLFYCGFDGTVDSSILIRTFICRHGWIQCPVGGGIVAQSNPVAEYEETLHKAEGMLRALR